MLHKLGRGRKKEVGGKKEGGRMEKGEGIKEEEERGKRKRG